MKRRRFLQIIAAATALPEPGRAETPPVRWQGTALGADAMLELHCPDRSEAERLVGVCLAEVARLEKIFSLYRPDSAICRLNRAGMLEQPPVELVELLSTSLAIHRATAGAFDPTVQPLWELYAAHFSKANADLAGPPAALRRSALARVDADALSIDADRIRFGKPGMGVTLNGIAQGYVTDRVVELLRAAGLRHCLVDMGETRALGSRADGTPWRVGLEDPVFPGQVSQHIGLSGRAIATSGGYGLQFDPDGRFNHLFDPRTGECSSTFLSVSVIAPTATLADGLSTALCLASAEQARAVAGRFGVHAFLTLRDASRLEL